MCYFRTTTDEAPVLLATPDNIAVSAGMRLSLVCVAWGNPSPNITWTPDPTSLPYQSVYTTNTTLNTLTYVVSILEICYTEPQFSGNYSCSASNGVAATSLGGSIATFQLQGELIIASTCVKDTNWARVVYGRNQRMRGRGLVN